MTQPSTPAPLPGATGFRGRHPVELRFGTSGLRGLVREMTDLEVYINCRGFLGYLKQQGELGAGGSVAIGEDLRAFDPTTGLESSPRIARAVACAARDEGLRAIHCGQLPTPALAYFATAGGGLPEHPAMAAIMVTGSHIPPDRNGVKFYRCSGEILKGEETAILAAVHAVRERQYALGPEQSRFDDDGGLRTFEPVGPVECVATDRYLQRYLEPWSSRQPLAGRKVVVLQHSAVGRDLLVQLLGALGAQTVAVGRSDEFLAIDTENLDAEARALLRAVANEHRPHAIVSTDGDSDRPLLADERGQFWPGDLVGVLTAQLLVAEFAAVPVSTTDALERAVRAHSPGGHPPPLVVERTRIGSPHVIAAMQSALAEGRERVVGWEANGGFLTASDIPWGSGQLSALPTRDAFLPLLCCLIESARQPCDLSALFARLPARRSCSGLVDGVPTDASRRALDALRPQSTDIVELRFSSPGRNARPHARRAASGGSRPLEPVTSSGEATDAQSLRERVAELFATVPQLGAVDWLNFVDGLRIGFSSGDVAHLRPSGNAPQFRIYALSDTDEQAARIVAHALREQDGIIARLVR